MIGSDYMREILFRAKLKDDYFNKGWQYGFVHCTWFTGSIFKYWLTPIKKENLTTSDTVCVNPETICEYTGLIDKNGTKIFEGDIVKTNQYQRSIGTDTFIIEFVEGNYYLCHDGCTLWTLRSFIEEVEVIGNKYDNLELIS